MGGNNKKKNDIPKIIKLFGLEDYWYRYDDEVYKKIEKAKEKGKYTEIARLYPLRFTDPVESHLHQIIALVEIGVIREDLLLSLHALITRDAKDIELLKDFKECISETHYKALLLSNTIKELEDNTFMDKVGKLKNRFDKKYKEEGKRIYNWHRSEYIRDYFHYNLCYSKFEFERVYPEKFRMFFEERLKFFERAVWSNSAMTVADIKTEISKRLKKRDEVKVYGRGHALVDRVTKTCEEYVESHPQYGLEKKKYKLGDNVSIEIRIWKIKYGRKK